MKYIFLSVFICCLFNNVWGQEERIKLYGIEGGVDFIGCLSPEKDYIRGDISSYTTVDATDNLLGLLYKYYFGAKLEVRTVNNKFGLLGGIRYNRMIGSVGKNTYWSDTPDFFYLLFRQDGTTTEYLKVKEIIQSSDCFGIPLELRIFPFNQKKLRVYFKAGAEFNYVIQTKTDVMFFNEGMNMYEADVAEIVGNPKHFYSTLYFSGGIFFGKDSKPAINIEVSMPSMFITTKMSNLVTPEAGGGFQLNVQLPF